jgi:hypothetical protein
MTNAPILLFTYKRVGTLQHTVNALMGNHLASTSELIIFSDGWKGEHDKNGVLAVRSYISGISGFEKVTVFESIDNKGLANSIIVGVSTMLNQYGKVIVLEDDLITSANFLTYMNKALLFYETIAEVFSISGYSTNVPITFGDDVYFTKRASSWGWATWKNRWDDVDWNVADFNSIRYSYLMRKRFNAMGSDLYRMLCNQMSGKIDSWAIRWTYCQFKKGSFTVYPTKSKVQNIGTSTAATHTLDRFNRFDTELDTSEQQTFNFPIEVALSGIYLNYFLKQYSIITRLKYKVLNKCF